jgi:hypothetical protein
VVLFLSANFHHTVECHLCKKKNPNVLKSSFAGASVDKFADFLEFANAKQGDPNFGEIDMHTLPIWLAACGPSSQPLGVERYLQEVKRNNPSKSFCGYTWSSRVNQIATFTFKNIVNLLSLNIEQDLIVSCKDCEQDPTCAICMECFRASDHEGHDYKIKQGGSGSRNESTHVLFITSSVPFSLSPPTPQCVTVATLKHGKRLVAITLVCAKTIVRRRCSKPISFAAFPAPFVE